MSKQENNNKDKLRVYEYAKSLNMSSKEVITILKRVGVTVNNHMSVMENDMVGKVEQFFKDVKAGAPKKPEAESKPQAEAVQTAAVQPKSSTAGEASPQTSASPRPQGQQSGTQQQRDRRPGQGQGQQGGQGGQYRGQGQGQGGQNRGTGGYQGSRTPGQGQQGGQGGYQGSRGPGQSGGQGGYQGNRGPGQSGGQGQAGRGPAAGGQRGGRPGDRPQQQTQGRPAATGTDRSSAPASRFNSSDRGPQSRGGGGKPNKRFEDNNRDVPGRGPRGRNQRGGNKQPSQPKPDNTPKKIIVRGTLTVGDLAKLLHKEVAEVIKKLLFLGVMATINQELDLDTVQLIATEFGVEVELKIPVVEDNFEEIEEKDDEADLIERPAVVTIMGHVDHGKTTLLDSIRKTNVTEGEAGGITQHIGAYQVEVNGKKITFLDTPGHEAFTSMRARGAQVTDITILVVAADDGVMPQTVEAINHAKAAKVPIIVAVNKVDKPEADVDRIKQALTEYELVPEEWGGETIFCNVSAKHRTGLENLLDMVLLVAEVQELKANPNKRARGTVIEAELDKGKGPVARILVQHGTLKVGDTFVAGVHFGRVRAMINDKGKKLKEAGPSTPVEITGLNDVPQAGDPFIVFEDERKARAIAERRAIALRETNMGANSRVTLDDLYKQIKEGEIKDLNVIIKADVQGTAEALKSSLEKIDVEGVRVKNLHVGAGAVTESDVILAQASNAIIIGFNVRPEPQAKIAAEQENVDIRLHRIIYNVIDEIEQAMKGMLDPIYKEVVIGHAEVRNVFKVTKVGSIAGCMITQGKIVRSAEVRLIRGGIVVHEGKIDSLKRFKDDVKEVAQGYECGISLDKYNDIKEGDIIEAFVMETVER